MRAEPLYIYLHVLKTAGMTLTAHFDTAFARDEILSVYSRREGMLLCRAGKRRDEIQREKLLDWARGLSEREKNAVRLVYGHWAHRGLAQALGREAKSFTFLRHPIARTLSHYNFLRTRAERKPYDDARTPRSFAEWITEKRSLHNHMTKMIAGRFCGESIEHLELTREHLEKAKRVLDEFYFVGLTETFDDDALFLYGEMGVCDFPEDRNASENFIPDAERKAAEELARAHNTLDLELYEYACRLNAEFKSRHPRFAAIVAEKRRQRDAVRLAKKNPAAYYASLPSEKALCGACGGAGAETLADNGRYGLGIRTVLCGSCGFLFTDPRPTAEAMRIFYRDAYRLFYTGNTDPARDHEKRSEVSRRASRLYRAAAKNLGSNRFPLVLDIGCGAGVLLDFFRRDFPESRLYGIEPDAKFAQFAALKTGARVIDLAIDAAHLNNPFGERFDVIILNHVLEHLHEPVQTLKALRGWLADGGTLVIEVPDWTSKHWIDAREMFHIAHLGHFHPGALAYALSQAGFEIASSATDALGTNPWALLVTAKKTDAPGRLPLPDASSYAAALRRLKERLKNPQGRRENLKEKALRHYRSYGARAVLKKSARFAMNTGKDALSRGAGFLTLPWKQAAAKRALDENAAALRCMIAGHRVVILGSGPSASELAAFPEDALLFTCNRGVLLPACREKTVDLYLCTKSKIERFESLEESLSASTVRFFGTDDPAYAQRLNSGAKAFYDDGEHAFFLRALLGNDAKSLRGRSHHGWTSSGIRLAQYALYFGASEIYLSGVDLGRSGYFWGKNPERWLHDDIDENFLRLAAKKYGNIYSLSASSPIARLVPHKNPWETVPA